MRWSDLSLEKTSVTIAQSLTERMTFKNPKNDKARTIAISDRLCEVLRSHRASQDKERQALGESYKDQDLVFAHADGTPVNPWNFGRAVQDCIRGSRRTSGRAVETLSHLAARANFVPSAVCADCTDCEGGVIGGVLPPPPPHAAKLRAPRKSVAKIGCKRLT